MPAIETKNLAGMQLDKVLEDVLDTDQNKWSIFFNPYQIKEVFSKLTRQIQNQNFFVADYSINIFFDFLKKFIQSEPININTDDLILLNEINKFFLECKKTILNQKKFNEEQIKIAVNFLQFINVIFWNSNKNLLKIKELFNINDLSEITQYIVKNRDPNTYIRNLIANYISIMKLSLGIEKFLLTYQKQDFFSKNIVELAKLIFSQHDSQALFTIPHFFSALAYEVDFIAHSWQQLNMTSSNVEPRQEKIIRSVTELQHFFLNRLNDKHNIPEEGLKYLFFKYFMQEAKEIKSSLSSRYKNFFYYSNEHFTPLPFSDKCSTTVPNKFIIKHAGLASKELKIICQAKECAEHNYPQWLNRMGVDSKQLPNSDFIYHVFNESNYDADLNYYEKYEPISTAMYQSRERNTTLATGWAYAQHRSNGHNQWQTTAHEYTHHLNFVAFGNIPSSFNEGLAYRLILSPCIDSSFQSWLTHNYNNYTSIELLSSQEFIGYNPSTLFMSYLVDTNPPIFAEVLQSYRNYRVSTIASITEKINQLIVQDTDFTSWLSAHLEKCSQFNFAKLGEGDGYCPPLLANRLMKDEQQNLITNSVIYDQTTLRLPRNTKAVPEALTAKKLTPNEMGRVLIFKISDDKLDEFRTLLLNGANPNFYDESTGNTPLHFLYFYGNCDTQYLELLLSYGANITVNKQGLLPYAMAEEKCNATQLSLIKNIFEKVAPINLNITTTKPHETELIPYQHPKLAITIGMPLSSFASGVIAGGWKEVAQHHSEHPYLPSIIFYGFKPASLAVSSAAVNSLLAGPADSIGLEDAWLSFAYYLGMNYLGLMFAQLGEKATQKIQNKLLNFLMPMLLYTFFLNPSLIITLISEGFGIESLQTVMMPLLSLLSSGILYKAGEYSTQKVIRKFFPINTGRSSNNIQDYFLRYSLDGTPKRISSDQKILQNIEEKLNNLASKIKESINKDAYKLTFEGQLTSATDHISTLLDEIRKEEQEINREDYKKVFKEFEIVLEKMQDSLNILRSKSKVKLLWGDVTEILTILRGIRPLPELRSPDLVADTNHGPCLTLEEEHIPLMTFKGESNHLHDNNGTHYQGPSIKSRITSIFKLKHNLPARPTEEELQDNAINVECPPPMA